MNINTPSKLYPATLDMTNCDKEPIHIIEKIQNHGVLIACQIKDKVVSRVSENSLLLFHENPEKILGGSINDLIKKEIITDIWGQLKKKIIAYREVVINNKNVTIIAHQSSEEYILELEINTITLDALAYQIRLTEIISEINTTNNLKEKCDSAVRLIKEHLAYDRVMIYQFDEAWNGSVIAEKREDHLESWLGLQYPATDIPQQARKLFLKQGVRIINDVTSKPENILSLKKASCNIPLDLSNSELRAVSPIHIEYLNNMNVGATLTAAIVYNDILWGLIACHHYSPKYINYYQRLSCKFLSQILATSIQLNNTDRILEKVKKSSFIRNKLIDQINSKNSIIEGLSNYKYKINDLIDATGAVIYIDNTIVTLGNCPSEDNILDLIQNIRKLTNDHLYHTTNLMSDYPAATSYKEIVSGVLCLFISKTNDDALLWFKPEVIQIVHWAGNPDKVTTNSDTQRISPRKSFEKWTVKQKGNSKVWKDYEISTAVELHKNILNIIVEKYEEVKALNDKLKEAYQELESFSYSVSHDLRAPLRGIDGFANIIKEEYYESLDDFGKSSIQTIISSVDKMNMLIDDILQYSGLGRKPIQSRNFSIKKMIDELLTTLQPIYPKVNVNLDNNIPDIYGDRSVILLLIKNLLENAMKYSSKAKKPLVTIGFTKHHTYFVKDNGIGFDIKHQDKIFGVFNRLVNEEYQGSGIGLAIAKRVVEKHNGKIWAKSKIGHGSTFYFKLKKNEN